MNPYWLLWGTFTVVMIPLSLADAIKHDSWAPIVHGAILIGIVGYAMYSGHRGAQKWHKMLAQTHARDRALDHSSRQNQPNSG